MSAGSEGSASGHSDQVEVPLMKAARWLAQTHHHDWGLLDTEARGKRVEDVMSQMRPFVDAFMHIDVGHRMEAMGMRALDGHDPHGRVHFVEDERAW